MKTATTIALTLTLILTGTAAIASWEAETEAIEFFGNLDREMREKARYKQERNERRVKEFNDDRAQERRHREMVHAIRNSGTCPHEIGGCRRR